MLDSLIRLAKRLAVLVPGLVIAYVSIFTIFPELNEKLPLVVALIVTYVLAAYVLIPGTIRVFRIIFPADHLPYYCVTRDGFASDPLNIALLGTRQELIDTMTAAGWHMADKLTLRTAFRMGLSTVYNWNYPRGPVSSLFLFGRMQDLAFQMPVEGGDSSCRHHVRFWAASYTPGKKLSVHSIHWQNRQAHVRDDKLLWVGAASRDIGVTFIRHTAQFTHLVDSDTNAERDLIVDQLQDAQLATIDRTVKLDEPYTLLSMGWRSRLETDGRMSIMNITPKTANQYSDLLALPRQ